MSDQPAAIVIQSLTRRIALRTPMPEEGQWVLLLVPDGSSDADVLRWASETLPAAALDELAEIIEFQAEQTPR